MNPTRRYGLKKRIIDYCIIETKRKWTGHRSPKRSRAETKKCAIAVTEGWLAALKTNGSKNMTSNSPTM